MTRRADVSLPTTIGMIHGRFQPFHNGHVEYLKEAVGLTSKLLIIGITNPSRSEAAHVSDTHRHRVSDNPYSYTDRALMIARTLSDIKPNVETIVVPFWLDAEHTWSMIPKQTVQFVNVMDEWDEEKMARFDSYGFTTVKLTSQRIVSGQQIRSLLASNESVTSLVPWGTETLIAGSELCSSIE